MLLIPDQFPIKQKKKDNMLRQQWISQKEILR